MEKLKAYECFSGETLEEYIEICKIYYPNEDENGLRTYARIFNSMGGVFWSNKYQRILPGRSQGMKLITLDEFKTKLKNTLSCKN